MIQFALHHTRRILAGSKAGLYLVTKIRNQCQFTIGIAHGSGVIDPELNGEARWLRSVVDSVQYFVDVGANKGEWSEMVLREKQVSGAVLIEPSLSAQDLLKARFVARAEVGIVEAAAGNSVGSACFFEEQLAGETSSLIPGVSENARGREVRVTTVDYEVEKRGWPQVDFLKVDAEGFDFHVLEGCEQLLSKGRVCFGQFEYNTSWKQSGTTLTFALDWLRRLGYQCFLIRRDGLHPPKIQFYDEYFFYSNYAIIRNDLVEEAVQRSKSSAWMNLP